MIPPLHLITRPVPTESLAAYRRDNNTGGQGAGRQEYTAWNALAEVLAEASQEPRADPQLERTRQNGGQQEVPGCSPFSKTTQGLDHGPNKLTVRPTRRTMRLKAMHPRNDTSEKSPTPQKVPASTNTPGCQSGRGRFGIGGYLTKPMGSRAGPIRRIGR